MKKSVLGNPVSKKARFKKIKNPKTKNVFVPVAFNIRFLFESSDPIPIFLHQKYII